MDDIAFVMPFFFPTQRVALDPYWLVNATVSYKLQPGVEVFARVENVLDRHYQEVFGFESPPIAAYAGRQADVRRAGRIGRIGAAWARIGREAHGKRLRRGRAGSRRCCWPELRALALGAAARFGAEPAAPRSSRSTCAPTSCWSSWSIARRIAAVTHLAADPTVSAIPEKARGMPVTRGGGRGRAQLRPRSDAGRPVRRVGHASTCCAGSAGTSSSCRCRRTSTACAPPCARSPPRPARRRDGEAMIADFDRRLARLAASRQNPSRRRSSTRSAARCRDPGAWRMRPLPPPDSATVPATIA